MDILKTAIRDASRIMSGTMGPSAADSWAAAGAAALLASALFGARSAPLAEEPALEEPDSRVDAMYHESQEEDSDTAKGDSPDDEPCALRMEDTVRGPSCLAAPKIEGGGGESGVARTAMGRSNAGEIERVQTLRLSSTDVSAVSSTTYRYLDLTGDKLVVVELPSLHVQLRRTLCHPGDGFVLNGSVVTISPQPDAASLIAHIEELGRTVDPDFRMRAGRCECGGRPREWKAFSKTQFSLAFIGGLAHVLGAGSFHSAGAQGRWAIAPQPIDDSLARVVTVSVTEIGGGDESIIATLLVDSDRDVAPHDGRGDARTLSRAIETRALTISFAIRYVDGTPAVEQELVAWSAVLRLGFLPSDRWSYNIASQVIEDTRPVANGHTAAGPSTDPRLNQTRRALAGPRLGYPAETW